MKRYFSMILGTLLLSGAAIAQMQSAPPPPTPTLPSSGNKAPSKTQKQAPAEPEKPAAPTEPVGGTKTAPVPKTKEEAAAMQDVLSKGGDAAAMLAATDDFSAKFPDSNVKGMLYRQVMISFDQAGNADKGYEAGRKALSFDPDDPLTLSECAMYLAKSTKDSDLDKAERLTEAKKFANDALANIDQLRVNNKAPQGETENVKNYIRGQSYDALAISAQAMKDWPAAEENYAKSAALSPDPATLLRLGFAQRMQNKLEAARDTFQKALDAANKSQDGSVVASIATQQKESVEKAIAKEKANPTTIIPSQPVAAPTTPKQ